MEPTASTQEETEQQRADRLREESLRAAWQKTLLARHDLRPYTLDYVQRLFQNFSEIHGDRRYADDPAIVTGMAVYHGTPVMIVGIRRGVT